MLTEEHKQELKNRALAIIERQDYVRRAKSYIVKLGIKYIEFPIFIDCVIDKLRWNVAEQRFDRLGLLVSIDEKVEASMIPNTCLAQETKYIYIEL